MTNQEAHEYLAKMRWGSKIKCPYCDSQRITKRKLSNSPKHRPYICGKCNNSFSAITKTAFHNIKSDLASVFELLNLMQIDKDLNVNRAHKLTGKCRRTIRSQMAKLESIGVRPLKKLKAGRPETDCPTRF